MRMTLLEMKGFTKSILGDGAGFYKDQTIVDFLNQGASAVAQSTLSLLTYSDTNTVATQERYALPLDFLSLKEVFITIGDRMQALEPATYDEYHSFYSVSQHGEPHHYKIEFGAVSTAASAPPGDVWLQPIPTEIWPLRIAYYQRPSKLEDVTDDNNAYELQGPFHRAVCYHAALNLCLRYDDNSRATKFKALFDEAMQAANSLVSLFNRSEPNQFGRTYGCGKSSWRRKR